MIVDGYVEYVGHGRLHIANVVAMRFPLSTCLDSVHVSGNTQGTTTTAGICAERGPPRITCRLITFVSDEQDDADMLGATA